MQQGSDDSASLGVGLVHQRVQVGQERVAGVQHVPGRRGESFIPGHGVLPLLHIREHKSGSLATPAFKPGGLPESKNLIILNLFTDKLQQRAGTRSRPPSQHPAAFFYFRMSDIPIKVGQSSLCQEHAHL